MLEVLVDHSTEGRNRGESPLRSGRRGSETQATRCREGETRSSIWWEETCERLELTKHVNGNPPDCVPARLEDVLEGSSRWAPVTSGEVLARTWFLLRNRMSELFTYGSVGGAGHNPGAKVPGEGPLLPGGNPGGVYIWTPGVYIWTPVSICRNRAPVE